MKPIAPTLLLGMLAAALATPTARGQMTAAERYKQLTNPDAILDAKLDKEREKNQPPFEFFRSSVAPFDVLPYIKPSHWHTISLEMQANLGDYEGYIQSEPVRLLDMPQEVVFRRDARLLKEQRARLSFQVLFPRAAKELGLELTRPGAIRADGGTPALLRLLEPHQMLIPILSPEPGPYNAWGRMQASIPASGDRDPLAIEKQRYYRLVIPQDPDSPVLSPHPLTWTTISHVVWDSLDPAALDIGQQQAMLDWLHFGGQLIVTAGPGSTIAPLQDSFLGAYLPAIPAGRTDTLTEEDLQALAEQYRAPTWPEELDVALDLSGRRLTPGERYKPVEPIRPGPGRPLQLTGLDAATDPGVRRIPVDPNRPDGPILAVERRVGRGRLTLLAFNPSDPALTAWPGLDTLVRRVVLRRPEERWEAGRSGFGFLAGPYLSWFRLLGRDLGARAEASEPVAGETPLPTAPVAAWLDTQSQLPVDARKALEAASGISVPGSDFVLKVILAYVIALVPLNWLICRFVLRRRELAWALVPVLALGFAITVERAAAYDLGFDSACDEIDLLEIQADYPRGHLSRFATLYSTGRVRYNVSHPSDPTALVLPMNTERALKTEEVRTSVFQSLPEPALLGYEVQPRSLAMFRAEQVVNLPGGVAWTPGAGGTPGRLRNGTGLELRDAVLIDAALGRRHDLGTIAPEATVAVVGYGVPLDGDEADRPQVADRSKGVGWVDLEPFLKSLRGYRWPLPEDAQELRLVAWTPEPHPGQRLDPEVDRHRGFRLVVAHVSFGTTPDPAGPSYNSLATMAAPPAGAQAQ